MNAFSKESTPELQLRRSESYPDEEAEKGAGEVTRGRMMEA